jgi:hypothetical protein
MREISGEIKTTTDDRQSLSGDDHKASQTLWKERVKQRRIHLYRGTGNRSLVIAQTLAQKKYLHISMANLTASTNFLPKIRRNFSLRAVRPEECLGLD